MSGFFMFKYMYTYTLFDITCVEKYVTRHYVKQRVQETYQRKRMRENAIKSIPCRQGVLCSCLLIPSLFLIKFNKYYVHFVTSCMSRWFSCYWSSPGRMTWWALCRYGHQLVTIPLTLIMNRRWDLYRRPLPPQATEETSRRKTESRQNGSAAIISLSLVQYFLPNNTI